MFYGYVVLNPHIANELEDLLTFASYKGVKIQWTIEPSYNHFKDSKLAKLASYCNKHNEPIVMCESTYRKVSYTAREIDTIITSNLKATMGTQNTSPRSDINPYMY